MNGQMLSRWLALAIIAALSLGFRAAPPTPFPNFDKRTRDVPVAAEKHAAAAKLREAAPELMVSFDPVTQSAAHVTASSGFLSGVNGTGKAIRADALAEFARNDSNRITKAFLKQHRALFGHGPEALEVATLKRDFTTAHNGLRTVVWEQRVDDIPVFEGVLLSHLTAKGELASVSSHFVSDAVVASHRANVKAGNPRLPVIDAVQRAAKNLDVTVEANDVTAVQRSVGAQRRHLFRTPQLVRDTAAELVWLPMSKDELRLCWDVVLKIRSRGEVFRLLVDAQSGAVLLRRCLTDYAVDSSYLVFTSDSPSPFSPGHSTPLTTQPPLVNRLLVTLSALNTNASPNGWIDETMNETLGNNVDAHLDRNDNDAPDLPRPQGSPSRVFDFPLDLTQPPTLYGDASVVQLFYWANFIHDKLYELGFTEAAGNFQADNFGRGGFGNDPVQADAQDGGGFDNANMFTPPDGTSPRLQMYLFSGPQPHRDGALDAEVVLHEYTHGLSERLLGGGIGISALQTAGMGEGWSDFYALSLLSEPSDDVDAAYAFGAYVTFNYAGLLQNYYSGIRRYPYSTDLMKNPLTFRDIDPAQASMHSSVPNSPVFGGGGAAEVHNQGELWCVTLWEARANLVHKHGWTNGNRLMLQLVTDAMNLSPANPNFLQARDAIIQADLINNDGANRLELWSAFAKRGMGGSATSPPSDTTSGVHEAFDLPDDLSVTPNEGFITSGAVGGPFTVNSKSYTLRNNSSNDVSWAAFKIADWLDLSPASGSLPTGGTATVTISLNAQANAMPTGIYNGKVWFTNLLSGRLQSRGFTLRVAQPDYFSELFERGFDLAYSALTFTPDNSPGFYSVCRESVTNFFSDPSGGTGLSLIDDSFAHIVLEGTNQISIYGHSTNALFIGSNGYLTFDEGDDDYNESFFDHFRLRRVAGLFRDLNPAQKGEISWQQLSDRLAVTYNGVTEYGLGNTNTFQVEMFFDGRIRITYLQIDATRGLTGLSQGAGVPLAFDPSDLSKSAVCEMPVTPRISITRAGNEVIVNWTTIAARTYQLETKSAMEEMWVNAGPEITAQSVLTSVTNSISAVQKFYRVRLLP